MDQHFIHNSIHKFVSLIDDPDSTVPSSEDELVEMLDGLTWAYHLSKSQLKTPSDLEPETVNADEIRQKVVKLFPDLGYYNVPEYVSKNIARPQMLVADAIDDIVDIYLEMHKVLDYWQAGDIPGAMWQFEWGYLSHWGAHTRQLQWYL